jgi:hypothetical protein
MVSNRACNVERKNNSFCYNKFGYKRRMGDHAAHDICFFSLPLNHTRTDKLSGA